MQADAHLILHSSLVWDFDDNRKILQKKQTNILNQWNIDFNTVYHQINTKS